MQNFVTLYEENAAIIQRFISATLRAINIHEIDADNQRVFEKFPSLELIYQCDENQIQTGPNYFRKKIDHATIGIDRSYLMFKKMANNGIAFLNPYISISTGSLCITAIYKVDNKYILFDFELKQLLQRINLIEENTYFRLASRISYGLIGNGLLFFAIVIVAYGFYNFFHFLFSGDHLSLDLVFKPVIALTLGLAVFDLGKTIVEQEVLPKSKTIIKTFNAMTLMNFSTSIIIALLIEALLVVFKISITNYKDLPYASVLIAALAFLLLVFSIFVYLISKSNLDKKEKKV